MSSNDVGSYELKRSPCEMQMDSSGVLLPRTTSDGSADDGKRFHFSGSAERFGRMGSAPMGVGDPGGGGLD